MRNIDPKKSRRFVIDVLKAAGVPEQDAVIVADNLVDADVRGIRSHGLMRLATYVERLRRGLCQAVGEVTVVRETPSTALLDGGGALGQVVGNQAMRLAISKAEATGVGAVVARNSNHFGTASYYALQAANKAMVGIAASNTAPLMPAPGGAQRVIGNNPLAIAAPSAERLPVVLDMAMSNVAMGKIINARDKGEAIPADWATDSAGTPTTDPNAAMKGGFLLPAGGPKGYGLAVMVEILTGVLGGGDFAAAIPSMYDMSQKQGVSHLMVALNTEAFMPSHLFAARVEELAVQLKASARAPGVSEVFLPGEIELLKGEASAKGGIAYDDRLLQELEDLARSLGVTAQL